MNTFIFSRNFVLVHVTHQLHVFDKYCKDSVATLTLSNEQKMATCPPLESMLEHTCATTFTSSAGKLSWSFWARFAMRHLLWGKSVSTKYTTYSRSLVFFGVAIDRFFSFYNPFLHSVVRMISSIPLPAFLSSHSVLDNFTGLFLDDQVCLILHLLVLLTCSSRMHLPHSTTPDLRSIFRMNHALVIKKKISLFICTGRTPRIEIVCYIINSSYVLVT